MLSAAERQKRYRHHRKGDHSLCDRKTCPDAPARKSRRAPKPRKATTDRPPALQEPAPTADEATTAPVATLNSELRVQERFGTRGAALWAAMEPEKLAPTHRVLLEEACRIADRLDRLDAMLAGREDWVRLQARNDEATEVTVIVDNLLAESRQQATTLRGLVAEVRAATPAAKRPTGRPAVVADTPAGAKGAGVADLAARAARRRASAG